MIRGLLAGFGTSLAGVLVIGGWYRPHPEVVKGDFFYSVFKVQPKDGRQPIFNTTESLAEVQGKAISFRRSEYYKDC